MKTEIFQDSEIEVSGAGNPVLFCLGLLENRYGIMIHDAIDRDSFLRAAKLHDDPNFRIKHVWANEDGEVMELIRRIADKYGFAIIMMFGTIQARSSLMRYPKEI